MPSFLSPDTYILERDLSTNVPGVATSIAAYVGRSVWGPVFSRTLVADEKTFATIFGLPTDNNYEDFFTVAGFLKYGNTLYFVRAVDPATAKNSALNVGLTATASAAGEYISNFETHTPTFGTEKFQVFGKYPGAWGNTNIKVALVSYTAWNEMETMVSSAWSAQTQAVSAYKSSIEYGPTATDEYVLLVYVYSQESLDFQLAESYLISDTKGSVDTNGNNIYVEDRVNPSSDYVILYNNTAVTSEVYSFAATAVANGADGLTQVGDVQTGYDLFANPEEIEINFLIGGSHTDTATAVYILAIAQQRADDFCILDVPKTDVVDQANVATAVATVIDYRKNELNANTSFGALYANWFYIYDKYNDKNRWIPSSGHVAGIYAFTADTTDTWFAPAGLNRGILRGVIKTAINPSKTYRDSMYQAQVNPIVSFPGQGIVVWGQKTLQTKPSAFDRVNVRLLFNYMEKAIAKAAKYVVFEQNDNLTRAMFTNMVNPFMDDIKGRRGVYDYLVDVSDKVNTPERIDQNQFWAEIYVKPVRSAEFIVIRFTATKTGVDFSELTA